MLEDMLHDEVGKGVPCQSFQVLFIIKKFIQQESNLLLTWHIIQPESPNVCAYILIPMILPVARYRKNMEEVPATKNGHHKTLSAFSFLPASQPMSDVACAHAHARACAQRVLLASVSSVQCSMSRSKMRLPN